MFANSATANTNYRQKNGTQTRFLVAKPRQNWRAKPECAFHFFVIWVVCAFVLWTLAPITRAQETSATSTVETQNDEVTDFGTVEPLDLEIGDYLFDEQDGDQSLDCQPTGTDPLGNATTTEELVEEEPIPEPQEQEDETPAEEPLVEPVGDENASSTVEILQEDLPSGENIDEPTNESTELPEQEEETKLEESLEIETADETNATSVEEIVIEEETDDEMLIEDIDDNAILAVWAANADGSDDDAAPQTQFMPSGQYQVSKDFQNCAVVVNDGTQGVFGQQFLPVAGEPLELDGEAVFGYGQMFGPAFEMQKLSVGDGFDAFCEKIQKNNPTLAVFSQSSNFVDLCAADGMILSGVAAVYCAPKALAYNDIPGSYQFAAMAKLGENDFSRMLKTQFAYLPKAAIEVDFNNIQYGQVKKGVEAVVDETITNAMVRNTGNIPAMVSVWQDDMGIGQDDDGRWNIRYGARIGRNGAWTFYKPFETVILPGILAPGEPAEMEFSVKVSDFPRAESASQTDYQGQMKIDAVPVSDEELLLAGEAGEPQSEDMPMDNSFDNNDDNDNDIPKPENEEITANL